MIIESMAVEGLYNVSLALSTTEKWKAAGSSFSNGSATEGWLTALAVVALIISEILLFWVFSKYRRSEQRLNQELTDSTVKNIKLRQENDKLKTDNEKLKKEIAVLKQEEDEVQENKIDVEASVN